MDYLSQISQTMEKYFRISKKNRKSNKRLIANQAATDKYKPRATQALIFETIEWRSLRSVDSRDTESPSSDKKHR